LETLEPIVSVANVDLQPSDELLEALSGETFEELSERVGRFVEWWKVEGPALTVVCSHGDWLPIAVHKLLGSVVYFKKGGWLELDWFEEQAHLRWYIPTFKNFGS
ncbi:MAG: histidine phosphatase family protein, partial [Pseudomonadota bacterium]